MEIHEDCVLTGLQALDAEDVLRQLAECLERRGCTKEGFLEALLARERAFPTGIPTKTLTVAIPHADPEYVAKAALAVAVLKQGVAFRQMDDPDQTLDVRVVLLIALHEPDAQIEFLRRFALAMRSDEFLPSLLVASEPAEARRIVVHHLIHADETAGSGAD
jgi:PTS system galactitol-specific IIA component